MRSTGLADSRITASRAPIRNPSTITTAVSHSDSSSPSSTAAVVKYRPTTPHWKASLRTTELRTIANSSRASAAVIRRPVFRRGTIRGTSVSGAVVSSGCFLGGIAAGAGVTPEGMTIEGLSGGGARAWMTTRRHP
ncbi:hypothetical protein SALBM217S_05691 [Streptomyces griseoloalbus]